MKKTLIVAVACVAALFIVAPNVHAQAIVINADGLCGMVGADADGNIIGGGFGEVNRVLENDNWVQLDCKGSEITNLSGRGQNFRGFLCGIASPGDEGSVLTTDTHATVSASGQGTLSCKYER